MNEKTTSSSNLPESEAVPSTGINRRRLVRAGLTAAPVMAALQSNSVLAGGGTGGNCLRPSTFSSLYMAGPKGLRSRNPRAESSGVCKSPSDWVGHLPDKYKNVMFLAGGWLPDDDKGGKDKDKDKDKGRGNNGNGNPNNGSSTIKTPFTVNPGRLGDKPYEHATLGDVLASTAGDDYAKLARYVTAAYLSNATRDGWLQLREITAIWEGRGNWTTLTNEQWDRAKTLAFFEMVYYGKSSFAP